MTFKVQIDWKRDSAGVVDYKLLPEYNKMTQYRNTLGDAIISSTWSDWVDNKAKLRMEFDSEGTWTKLKNYSHSLNNSDGSSWHPHHRDITLGGDSSSDW